MAKEKKGMKFGRGTRSPSAKNQERRTAANKAKRTGVIPTFPPHHADPVRKRETESLRRMFSRANLLAVRRAIYYPNVTKA